METVIASVTPPPRTAPIQVLLVEDHAEQASLTRTQLARPAGEFQVEWVPNLMAALDRLKRPGIDVTVLDLDLPELQGHKSHKAIRLMAPGTPVVIFTADDFLDSRDITMAAGAEDYLVKGQTEPEQLRQSVRRAFHRGQFQARLARRKAAGAQPGRAIAFFGAKGGVGATTSLLGIARALAAQHAAIAVESTWQSGFAFQLTPPGARSGRGFPPKMDRDWLVQCIEPTDSGEGLLISPLSPWRHSPAVNSIARRLMCHARNAADFVLADAGYVLDGLAGALISVCQGVVVVTDCERASAGAAKQTLRSLAPWSRSDCPVRILAVNRSGLAHPPSTSQLEDCYGCPVLGVVPYTGPSETWSSTEPTGKFGGLDPAAPATATFLELAWRLGEDAA